jgi:hypothetical protein
MPHLEPTVLPPLEVLYDFDDPITHLYFANRNTVISTLSQTEEDVNVEVAICGNEGVVGLSGILGSTNSPYQNLVQVPGTGSRLPIEGFHPAARRNDHLQRRRISDSRSGTA